MRFQINRIPPLALYWAFIVLLSFVNIFCVYYQLLGHDPFPFRSASITSAAESLMLLLPFVFLRRRWLWIAPAWFVLLSAVELSNLLFYRNFDDFISPSSYFTAANFNGFVFDSALASLRRSDIVFALTSLAAVAVTSFIVRRRPVPSRRLIISYAAVALLFAAMQFTHAVRSIRFYHPQPLSCALRTYAGNFRQDASWLYYMTTFGFPGYFVRAGVELARPGFSPTEADFAMSRRFWQAHALAQPPLAPSVGSVLAANTRKNLVFIVVESLNSKLFDLPERDTVMPGLTALAADSAVLFCPAITPLTGLGRSSDGQFMYNTGMLPLAHEPFAMRHADAPYPSLAKILDRESLEVIGEERCVWSHAVTSRSYGFNRLVSDLISDNPPVCRRDSIVFAVAADGIRSLSHPFFAMITTIGMHQPYIAPTGVDLALSGTYHATDLRYLEAVHAFDAALTRFLGFLRGAGLYDDTLVVIVADHEVTYPVLGPLFDERRIPMLILNSGLTRDMVPARPAMQTDVFPTVLDALGRTDTSRYRGVGNSLLRPLPAETAPLDTLRRVSEINILSREILLRTAARM